MYVADQLGEVAIGLAENGFVPALKEVPDFLVFSIVVLTVGGEQSLHDPADRMVLHSRSAGESG